MKCDRCGASFVKGVIVDRGVFFDCFGRADLCESCADDEEIEWQEFLTWKRDRILKKMEAIREHTDDRKVKEQEIKDSDWLW